ncbi:MAG: A/G-specific adenine glycosylase [Treponema sp.]|nr:A/G-specific adenine glycosylase [Treponema sp.]
MLSDEEISAFRSTILENYRLYGRSFPWRKTHDPYAVLVSEMMLQQTQTLRVLPKYEAWLALFPDAPSLAAAPLADVLAAWNGLGYNSRAKYLQNACREVCGKYGGVFPDTKDGLDSLPGVGPYTAGAVSAFAYNNPEIFIETNIRSVFIFFFFNGTEKKVPDAELLPLVGQTLDRNNPREWYYALMDYGAELKRRVKNPSRKSAQYAKQSKFEGSLRQARGAILRRLTEKGEETLALIADAEHIDLYRLEKAAEKLTAEKLVCEKDGVYHIAE